MMQMNIERMINATGSLLIWLVMILAAVILAGLIIIAAKAISQGIRSQSTDSARILELLMNIMHTKTTRCTNFWKAESRR